MKFNEVFIDDTKNVSRIDSKEFNQKGNIAIIDQGKELIAGYTDVQYPKVCCDERIIFGDHTRIFKYIDFPFVCGADGTKVLKVIDPNKVNCKYMYYYLLSSFIPNTGYNRHFKWVKELDFKIPKYDEQLVIVNKLDKIEELIKIRKDQIKKLEELQSALMQEYFE
ncbi:MAG: restriction endonuclease subunit S [Bacilli bacterium]|nr:restriction endonuclease subunit S [Bacilli bacterium]